MHPRGGEPGIEPSRGSYLMAHFDDKQRLLPTVEALLTHDQVIRWDAVDGYYSLVVRLRDSGRALAESLGGLDGCTSVSRCVLLSADERGADRDPEMCYGYALIEAALDRRDVIARDLANWAEVQFACPTMGDFDVVALLRGEHLGDIDRLADRIRALDGVLRLKRNHVLELDRI